MDDQPTGSFEADAEYWGLDWREKMHFFGRISRYYGAKRAYHARMAAKWMRITDWLNLAFIVVMAAFLLLQIIKLAR
jgi:hypothetical protein